MKTLESILSDYWDYNHFRPFQKEIITAVLEGQDTLALLPTGGGKSLCYQLPALVLPGLTLVVSPLIALMQDQVQQLRARGIPAMQLESEKPAMSLDKQLDNITHGPYKILFVSPERLQNPKVIERLQNWPVQLIAIDEAHCVSEWGHDFRPAFLSIQKIRKLFDNTPILALTASATPAVVRDIEKQLALRQTAVFQSSFDRPNLSYQIVQTVDKFSSLRSLLTQQIDPMIVYCRTRKQTETLAKHLSQENYPVGYFHGGLTEEEKKERLTAWLSERNPIMIATMAFGMGIDKANVRQVIHMSPPESMENYYQETGRAGRDGAPSKAIMLVGNADYDQLRQQFLSQLPSSDDLKRCYKNLCNYLQIAYGEGYEHTYYFDFSSFIKQYEWSPTKALNCIKIFEKEGLWQWKSVFRSELQVLLLHPPKKIIQQTRHAAKNSLFQLLVRHYPKITQRKTTIELKTLANLSGYSQKQIQQWLEEGRKDGWMEIDWITSDSSLEWMHPREDAHTWAPVQSRIKHRNHQKKTKINQIIAFCQNNNSCKRQQLLHYFGEKRNTECKNCSATCCTKAPEKGNTTLEKKLQVLLEKNPSTVSDLVQQLPFDSDDIVVILRRWASTNKVQQNKHHQWEWTTTDL